jgi:hypothetical protein
MATETKRLRFEVRAYADYSGTIPVDGSPNVLSGVPGYAEDRRVLVTGNGASTIEELVKAITPGVQEAQFVTTNTEAVATALYTKLATITLEEVGAHNELKMNVLVASEDSTNGSVFDVTFSAVQVSAFGNDPVIDAKVIKQNGTANIGFFYVIEQNDPTAIIHLYAGITGANTELHGFVTSETVPASCQFFSLNGFETLAGEVAFTTGTITASLIGDVTGDVIGNADTATKLTSTTGDAPVYGARAVCHFDGLVNADITATYAIAGTVCTITKAAHGHLVGHRIYLTFTSGTGTTGMYLVASVPTADTFTVVHSSMTTSGNVTENRRRMYLALNVHSVAYLSSGQFAVNMAVAMPDIHFAFSASASDDNVVQALVYESGSRSVPYRTVSSLRLYALNPASGVPSNFTQINAIIFR